LRETFSLIDSQGLRIAPTLEPLYIKFLFVGGAMSLNLAGSF